MEQHERQADSGNEGSGDALTEHEIDAVEAVAAFHREHYDNASLLQELIDRLTDALGRPIVFVSLITAVGLWTMATAFNGVGIDDPGFAWLELGATLGALAVALSIMVTQRREDQLASRRSQLILELALLSDKRSAKIIALLEELRRDTPDLVDRVDATSDAMSQPADATAALAAIEERAGAA